HKDKYLRKFEKIIDLLGPDHHGYINRMKAAVSAMGYDKSSIDILIVQLATLLRNGVAVSMSTRRAEFISLAETAAFILIDVERYHSLNKMKARCLSIFTLSSDYP
ncbi:arginyl-tRNA synthetase, partial [Candidatus Omnitrophus magneticus]